MRMWRPGMWLLGAMGLGLLASTSPLSAQARLSFYEPGISPDGQTIAFVHGGDIWTVPAEGGDARILIAHEEEESRPIYSPDGRHLAFESYRDGTSHIYLYDFATGEVSQLTFMSTSASLEAWSTDSEWIYFSSVSHDIAGMTDVLRVRASGGLQCRSWQTATRVNSGLHRPRMADWQLRPGASRPSASGGVTDTHTWMSPRSGSPTPMV